MCALHAAAAGPEFAVRCRDELTVLDWELTAQLRRSRWDDRWKGGGADVSTWYRTLRYLDNAITRGCPPDPIHDAEVPLRAEGGSA